VSEAAELVSAAEVAACSCALGPQAHSTKEKKLIKMMDDFMHFIDFPPLRSYFGCLHLNQSYYDLPRVVVRYCLQNSGESFK
jgi:hypothetical protein